SARLRPSYPFGLEDPKVYRLPLQRLDEPFRSDKYDELFKQPKKDTAKKDSLTPPIAIDAVNIMDRIEQISPSFGAQFLQDVVASGNKTIVLYTSNHDQGRTALWKTTLEPFESNKTEKINGAEGGNPGFVASNGKYFVLMNGNVFKVNLDASKIDPLPLS